MNGAMESSANNAGNASNGWIVVTYAVGVWGIMSMVSGMSLCTSLAHADDRCQFDVRGNSLVLADDCGTDVGIEIPGGVRFRGNGHTITVHDPEGGSFEGPVLSASAGTVVVENVTLVAEDLAPVCHVGQDEARLRGVLFDGASGLISGVRIIGLAHREGGCLEGFGIEVRNSGAESTSVAIAASSIVGYQRAGIVIRGNVDASLMLNRIEGLGATDRLAQNGIQISDGANATLWWNTISGNRFTPMTASSVGVLVLAAGPDVRVLLNRIGSNDIGVLVRDTPEAEIRFNRVADSTYVAVYDPDDTSVVASNQCVDGQGEPIECEEISGP